LQISKPEVFLYVTFLYCWPILKYRSEN
jgi:hypothetical protein